MEPQKLSVAAGASGLQMNLERDEAKEENKKGISILQVTGNF